MPPDSARAKAWAIANERLDLVEPWDKIRQRVAEIDIESDTNEGSQSLLAKTSSKHLQSEEPVIALSALDV